MFFQFLVFLNFDSWSIEILIICAQMEKDMLPQAESMELLKKLVEFPMDLATLQGTKIG